MTQRSHFWVYCPKVLKSGSWKDLCTSMFTVAKIEKPPKWVSANEWIEKMWFIHAAEYSSAMKMKKILLWTTMQMKLENILLSEINWF